MLSSGCGGGTERSRWEIGRRGSRRAHSHSCVKVCTIPLVSPGSSLSKTYQWLNVLCGAGFVVNSGWNGAYPSASINLIWMGIGIYGLLRGVRLIPKGAA